MELLLLFPPVAIGQSHAEILHENVVEEEDRDKGADKLDGHAFHSAFFTGSEDALEPEQADEAGGDKSGTAQQEHPGKPSHQGHDHFSVDLENGLIRSGGFHKTLDDDKDGQKGQHRQYLFGEEHTERRKVFAVHLEKEERTQCEKGDAAEDVDIDITLHGSSPYACFIFRLLSRNFLSTI